MCRFSDAGIETEVNEEKKGFSLPLGIKIEVKEEEGFLWHQNRGEVGEGWVLPPSWPQNGGERGDGGVHPPSWHRNRGERGGGGVHCPMG